MIDRDRSKQGEEDEVEIERLVVELQEGDDPGLGGEIAHHVLQHLSRMIEEM
jgi:hypothetical protein